MILATSLLRSVREMEKQKLFTKEIANLAYQDPPVGVSIHSPLAVKGCPLTCQEIPGDFRQSRAVQSRRFGHPLTTSGWALVGLQLGWLRRTTFPATCLADVRTEVIGVIGVVYFQ